MHVIEETQHRLQAIVDGRSVDPELQQATERHADLTARIAAVGDERQLAEQRLAEAEERLETALVTGATSAAAEATLATAQDARRATEERQRLLEKALTATAATLTRVRAQQAQRLEAQLDPVFVAAVERLEALYTEAAAVEAVLARAHAIASNSLGSSNRLSIGCCVGIGLHLPRWRDRMRAAGLLPVTHREVA